MADEVKGIIIGKTPGENRAHKRQVELVNEDAKRLCSVDISTPFRNLEDAVERLVPFHLFGALEPETADLEEVIASGNPELLATRAQLFHQHTLVQALDVAHKCEAYRQKVLSCSQRYTAPPAQQPTLLADDSYVIAKLMNQDAKDQLERERRKPAGHLTPERDEQQDVGGGVGGDGDDVRVEEDREPGGSPDAKASPDVDLGDAGEAVEQSREGTAEELDEGAEEEGEEEGEEEAEGESDEQEEGVEEEGEEVAEGEEDVSMEEVEEGEADEGEVEEGGQVGMASDEYDTDAGEGDSGPAEVQEGEEDVSLSEEVQEAGAEGEEQAGDDDDDDDE